MSTLTISSLNTINVQPLSKRKRSRPRYFQTAPTSVQAKTSTLELNLTSLNLQELCLEIIAEIEERFQSDISISFIFKGNSSEVYLDKSLIVPILINLLDNAVKFTQNPEIKVDLSVIVRANRAIFIVQDQGIGISVADKPYVFEPFYQGTNTDNIEGSGIGLTVVKICVDWHAGKIAFESIVGQGSKFIVSIPLAN